ncbi:MAG: hypothetical protein LBL90_02445 [Prevotellaceae bacterium]|nr:hypothetical protein [Prevotellaceae bacterium]
MDFRKQVKKELAKLNREQLVRFAWLCAMRALPFLGAKASFGFWKNNVSKHLYAVFKALDTNLYYQVGADDVYAAYVAAYAAADDAYDDAYDAAYAYAADAVYVAAYAAAYAAADDDAADAAADAADAANAAAISFGINIERILVQDIFDIKKGNHLSNVGIYQYGKIWDNFETALKNERCGYWANLYKDIFINSFEVDKDKLVMRMRVPAEIQEQGAAAVGFYLEDIESHGEKQFNEARIIILGEKGAGKTCLARKLVNPNAEMTTEKESTPGVDAMLWKPESEDLNIHIWDFAGHTVTHAVHRFFLSERSLYIIVYDGRTEERNRLEYWLDHMKNYGGDSKAIILINKKDEHIPAIPENSLKDKYPIEGFYYFSIKDDLDYLEKFRNDVAKYIKNNPSWNKLVIPKNFYKVKDELEKLFFKQGQKVGDEYISKSDFETIAQCNDIADKDKLLKSLHALGVCLWYEGIPNLDTLVLNPEWISYGVYQVINWVHEQRKYFISLSDFKPVFQQSDYCNRYPESKHKFIFDLMICYELAYKIKEDELVIPHLLPEDRPATLPEFLLDKSLMLRYKADQPLPPNTISRFIVRHNDEILKNISGYQVVWRYGVVLTDSEETIALVREEDRMITVSVKGQNKTNFLNKMRSTLNEIFNSYKSRKPNLEYRIERPDSHRQLDNESPIWLPEEQVFIQGQNQELYYDYPSGERINLETALESFSINPDKLLNRVTINYIHIKKNYGNVVLGNLTNNSTTFNFKDCNVSLQGDLQELIRSLKKDSENIEDIEYIEEIIEDLNEIGEEDKPEIIKKKGFLNKLKRFVDDLVDEESDLNKKINKLKKGGEIIQDIGKKYNKIAEWTGLPQIPRVFLGGE